MIEDLHREVSIEEAAKEILRRRKAREKLLEFSTFTKHNYVPDPFHDYLASELDLVADGKVDRLMIFAPPQHGKSELSTRRFPAQYIAKNPTHHIISASYNGDYATTFGREVRGIVQSPEYQLLYPDISIRSDNRSADEWQIEQGGKYYAVGVGGSTTGKSAHLFLIDDPIKDRAEADSETKRESHWDWYRDVVYTRLQTGGAIVMTLTRWHYDDVAGRALELMKQGKGKPWRIVCLPAIAEVIRHPVTGDIIPDPLGREIGMPLAPNRYTLEDLIDRQETMGPRSWAAMYQQRPQAEEGGMFRRGWFGEPITHSQLPDQRTRVRAWDFGGTADGDYTTGVLMSRDKAGVFYIEHVVRFRGSPHFVEQKVMEYAQKDGRSTLIHIPQDPGQAGKSQAEYYIRKFAGWKIKALRMSGDKIVRATPFAAQVEGHNVKIVKAGWNEAYFEELETFPLGVNDDQVDASSDAFNALLGPKRAAIREW